MQNQSVPIFLGVILAVVFAVAIFNPGNIISAQENPPVSVVNQVSAKIAYLTLDASDSQADLSSPQNIQQALGAELISDWSELLSLQNVGPIDALIIHDSAIGVVDPNALADMYDQGTVLAFFNTYSPTIADLTGDDCIARDGWMDGSDPYAGEFYIVVAKLVQGNPEDVALINEQATCDGEGEVKVDGYASIFASRSQNVLKDLSGLDELNQVILLDIQGIRDSRSEFEAK